MTDPISINERWQDDVPFGPVPQCGRCKHKLPGNICTAFPRGIPEEILLDQFDHRNPYPGDTGIQWEKRVVEET